MAIFASGAGSNARRLMLHGCRSNFYEVALVLTDQPPRGAEPRKGLLHSSCGGSVKETSSTDLMDILREHNIDFIVLAGFLRLIHKEIVDAFSQRIINLHPSFCQSMEGGECMGAMYTKRFLMLKKGKQELQFTTSQKNMTKGL